MYRAQEPGPEFLLHGPQDFLQSPAEESFERGLLEYPHYTRPADWRGHPVPEVLLSGHHDNIRSWRKTQAEHVTRERRPDLWARYSRAQDEDEG